MQIPASLGTGSGIDTTALVDNLVAADRGRSDRTIAARREKLDARVSALAQVSTAVTSLDDAFTSIMRSGLLDSQPSSNDNSVLKATKLPGQTPAADPVTIEVQAVAGRQTLLGPRATSPNSVVGQGTLTLKFGKLATTGGSVTGFEPDAARSEIIIPVNSSNNTLSGLQKSINALNAGISATIVNDGAGPRLAIKGSNGAINGFSLEAVETGSGNLADYGFTLESSATPLVSAAENSIIAVDGIVYERPDTIISDVIPGIKLEVQKPSGSTPIRISSGFDQQSLESTVSNFVDAYNQLTGLLTDTMRPATNGREAGPLINESALRDLRRALGGLTSERHLVDGARISFADIGVKTNRDGTLSLNAATLARTLSTAPQIISGIFTAANLSSDPGARIVSSPATVAPGRYQLTDIALATSGKLTGNSAPAAFATPLVLTSANNRLKIEIDGVSSLQIALPEGSYTTPAGFTAALQTALSSDQLLSSYAKSATVGWENDRLVIASNGFGQASGISIKDIDTDIADRLGLSGGTTVGGTDVSGKINGIAATGRGQRLSASGIATGLRVDVTSPSNATLDIRHGLAASISRLRQSITGSSGSLTSSSARFNQESLALKRDTTKLDSRAETLRQRLTRQFAAMDTAVGAIKSTQSFLQQQIDAWTGKNNN